MVGGRIRLVVSGASERDGEIVDPRQEQQGFKENTRRMNMEG